MFTSGYFARVGFAVWLIVGFAYWGTLNFYFTESGRVNLALISAHAFYFASSLLSTFVAYFCLGTSSSNIDFFSPKTLPNSPDNLFLGFSSSFFLSLLGWGKAKDYFASVDCFFFGGSSIKADSFSVGRYPSLKVKNKKLFLIGLPISLSKAYWMLACSCFKTGNRPRNFSISYMFAATRSALSAFYIVSNIIANLINPTNLALGITEFAFLCIKV